MLAEYQTQRGTVSAFAPAIERMRPAVTTSQSFSSPVCHDYMYRERRPRFYHTRHNRLSARTPCYRSLWNLRLGTRGVLGEGSNRKLAAYVANDLYNSIIRWL
jgi:hypothetical protein